MLERPDRLIEHPLRLVARCWVFYMCYSSRNDDGRHFFSALLKVGTGKEVNARSFWWNANGLNTSLVEAPMITRHMIAVKPRHLACAPPEVAAFHSSQGSF